MAFMGGCTRNAGLLKSFGITMRSDVFREVSSEEKTPAGYSELSIYSSLKTRNPGIYLFDNSKRGTSDYVLLVNIDGQVARIEGLLKEDKSVKFDDPEAGEGIKYMFQKNILLQAGSHLLIIACPEDGIAIEKKIVLKDGTKNIILLKPQYGGVMSRSKPAIYGSGHNFINGISGFSVWLNGEVL